jgi:DNA-binding MarR family transcriptional regulator
MNDISLSFQVLNQIGIINQLASSLFSRVMPLGLTMAQFTVLNHFVRQGGKKSPMQLASVFQVTKGTMTSTLQKLEQKGFIAVVGDESDARKKWVTITNEGVLARKAALAALNPHIAALELAIKPEIFTTLLKPLMDLSQYFDKERD